MNCTNLFFYDYIKNFKSIAQTSMPLGRINVFIGANGSGKSNILEAIGMAAAIRNGEVTLDSLVQRGVRIARPELTINSFYGHLSSRLIHISFYENETIASFDIQRLKSSLRPTDRVSMVRGDAFSV